MAAPTLPFIVYLEEGADEVEYKFNVQQRDTARSVAHFAGTDVEPTSTVGTRHSAWAAMKRQGLIDKRETWEAFDERCIQAGIDPELWEELGKAQQNLGNQEALDTN
jgi:hypothetical protein